jgi:SM-20-related protein
MATATARATHAGASRLEGELFDFDAFAATPLQGDPFDYLIVPRFIRPAALAALNADFPTIDGPGNFPPERLSYGPSFAALLEALEGPELAARFGAKFGVDLGGCHPTIAIRCHSEATDGNIHTDHKSKVITVLFYFNQSWPHEGGRLRLLRSATDMEDYVAESVPEGGAMLAFRRTDHSWHGHKPFVGERRILQLSYTRGGDAARLVSSLTKPIRRLLGKS